MLSASEKILPAIVDLFPGFESRTYFQDATTNEFWFHASNVCSVLGFVNVQSALALHCDEDEKLQEIWNGRATWFVSEAGCYGLAMGAKNDVAKKFKRWLKHSVLPKLRSRGIYATEAVTSRLKAAMQILQVEQTQRQIMSDGIESEQFKMDRFIRLIEQYNPRYKDDREELARSIQFLDKFWRADGWHHAEAYDRAEAYPPKYVLKRLQEALDLVAEALDIDLKTDSGLDTHHMMRNPNTLGSVIDFLLSKSQ